MTPTIRGVLLDIDNTLLSHSVELDDRLAGLVQQLDEKNIKVAVCTGRTFAMVHSKVLPYFLSEQYHIVAGGGQIINQQGHCLWQQLIPHSVVQDIAHQALQEGCSFGFGANDTYYAGSDEIFEWFSTHSWGFQLKHAHQLTDWSVPLMSIFDLTPNMCTYLEKHPRITAKIMPESSGTQLYADLTAKGVTKATAGQVWADHYGIPLANISAVGDSINDLEIMQTVGYPVAMGNAIPKLKNIAWQVVPPIHQQGAITFLRSLLE